MRALVISDTHFGAWTGRDLLREEFFLERLAPRLEGIDELIFLGDLFDFLFGSVEEAVDAADGLLRLIAERMAGGRLVFLAGTHGHYLDPHARLSGSRGDRLLTRTLLNPLSGGAGLPNP
jgi:UDP-2,3-diacylglucosamine pyrophosphatase LpxH